LHDCRHVAQNDHKQTPANNNANAATTTKVEFDNAAKSFQSNSLNHLAAVLAEAKNLLAATGTTGVPVVHVES
jgi:hypothetical protein